MPHLKCPNLNSVGPASPCGRVLGCLALIASMAACAQSSLHGPVTELTLKDYLERVISRNEKIQTQILEVEFNRRRLAAEGGTFEPVLFAEASRESTTRRNTVQERLSESGLNVFREHNNIYEGGLESLVPTGARVRLGYTFRDLRNNLPNSIFSSTPHTNAEYQTFFGLTMTQPLLKNGWLPANLAATRVAAISSDIAFQDYRRQMMVILSTAIATYWELYLAQEQLRFFEESVATADKILRDVRARVEAGRSSELEVLEAEAGLALRKSKRDEAEQKLYETANKALSLASMSVLDTNRLIRAVDSPKVGDEEFGFFGAWRAALDVNPDYLSQRLKAAQELVRLAYARNQRLPELNLKGSYGLNGLGLTPGESWDDIERQDFPSWSLGIELRVPLFGGVRSRNELQAAKVRCREAYVGLREIENQIANSVDTALHKIQSARNTVRNYGPALDFNENALRSALAQLDVGRIESRRILDIEASLLEARASEADARVLYQRAVIELELVKGSVLKKYDFDLSQNQLQTLTRELAHRDLLSESQYDEFLRRVRNAYDAGREGRAGKVSNANNPLGHPDSEPVDPVREALRKRIRSLQAAEGERP